MVKLIENFTPTISSTKTDDAFRDLRSLEDIINAPQQPEKVDYLEQLGERIFGQNNESFLEFLGNIGKQIIKKEITQITNIFQEKIRDMSGNALGFVTQMVEDKINNLIQRMLPNPEYVEGELGLIIPPQLKLLGEPLTSYNPEYPYHHVEHSESGHIFEKDDTPGNERLQTYHRSGTFEEYHPDGSIVRKITGDDYQISIKNKNISIEGQYNVICNSPHSVAIGDDMSVVVVGSSIEQVGKDKIIIVKGNVGIQADGNISMYAKGNIGIAADGDIGISAKGNVGIGAEMDVGISAKMNFSASGMITASLGSKGYTTVSSIALTEINSKGILLELAPLITMNPI